MNFKEFQEIINNGILLLAVLGLLALGAKFLYGDTYTRSTTPTSGNPISSTNFKTELDAIGTVINGNLTGTDNIKNSTIANADIANDSILTGKIKDGTLTPADMANLQTIAAGSLIYATATSTLGEITIGTSGQVLQSNGTIPAWSTFATGGWTDGTGIVYPDSVNDNVAIGGTAAGTSAKAVLAIYNNTVPTASITDGIQIYSEDVSSSAECKVRDEAGNVTTLSPHNFSLIPEDKIDQYDFPFSYYSYNELLGIEINVDMYGAILELENLTGKKFIYKRNIQKIDKPENIDIPSWLDKKIKKVK